MRRAGAGRTGTGLVEAAGSVGGKAIYILLPSGRSGPGGMCRMVDYYMTEWQSRRRMPPLVVLDTTGPVFNIGRQSRWRLWRQPLYFAGTLGAVCLAGVRGRIALLHLHISERGSVVRKALLIYLASVLRIPIVAHMHGSTFPAFYESLPRRLQRVVTHAFRKAGIFVVLGRSFRDYFVDRVGLDPARVEIVHNAVPCLEPVRRRTLSAALSDDGQAEPLFVFIGILAARKGLGDLLAAFAGLTQLPWRLRIIGDGDPTPWQAMAREMAISDRVQFDGWMATEAIHQTLAEADGLVLPAHNEGLPMVLIEAMAHACPVITTPVGSIEELVEDEVSGLLVPPGDVPALTAAIVRLLDDPPLRQRLGAAGRARYVAGFTMQVMNDRLQRLFAEAAP